MLLSYIVTLSDGLGLPTGEDFVNKVFPNIPSFVVQLAAFIILSIIVIKFAYKPVSKFIKKRREFVESTLDETRKENAEAKAKNEEAIKNLNDSKKQAMVIVEDGSIDVDSLEEEGLVPGKILVYRQGANTPTTKTEEFNNYLYEAMKEHCQYLETQMRNVIYYFCKNLNNIIDEVLKDETNNEE